MRRLTDILFAKMKDVIG